MNRAESSNAAGDGDPERQKPQRKAYGRTHLTILRKVRRTIEKSRAWNGVSRVIVAASGGADSSVLLHLMSDLWARGGAEVVAVHVHHGIRGSEADRDAAAVETMAKKWNVPFRLENVRPTKGTKSTEEELRSLRYQALENVASKVGAERIVLAHHQSDQAETVLMRIFGGADIAGLSGMKIYRPPLFVRPLLEVTKEEILAEAEGCRLPFVHDSSNDRTSSRRNFVRKNLLPMLRTQLNPKVEEQLAALAKSALEVRELVETLATDGLAKARRGEHAYDVHVLRGLPPFILRSAMILAFQKIQGQGAALGRRKLEVLERMIRTEDQPKRFQLSGQVLARRKSNLLSLMG